MNEPVHSQAITVQSASNLALAFVILPKQQRQGMTALYAFCRAVDDIADEDQESVANRRRKLERWREGVADACRGREPDLPVLRELFPVIQNRRLPYSLLDELIQGVEMDLEIRRYENYQELELYCYRVASVVGLLSIEIFGYTDPGCREYAVHLGKALQLTNILRDVRNDAERGRLYLPLEEMRSFGVTEAQIFERRYSESYWKVASSVASRAEHFFNAARAALPERDRRSMVAAELMGAVYWRLFRKLHAARFDVFGPRPTRVGSMAKACLILRAWLRATLGTFSPSYGTAG
ncbi:MAG: presqualene diphosphate synthase HpnD [Verrucomicrobia bacterium]|nr:presqualene diphosphate synthase HpnD [Verrucomicrobiota bacterium]